MKQLNYQQFTNGLPEGKPYRFFKRVLDQYPNLRGKPVPLEVRQALKTPLSQKDKARLHAMITHRNGNDTHFSQLPHHRDKLKPGRKGMHSRKGRR